MTSSPYLKGPLSFQDTSSSHLRRPVSRWGPHPPSSSPRGDLLFPGNPGLFLSTKGCCRKTLPCDIRHPNSWNTLLSFSPPMPTDPNKKTIKRPKPTFLISSPFLRAVGQTEIPLGPSFKPFLSIDLHESAIQGGLEQALDPCNNASGKRDSGDNPFAFGHLQHDQKMQTDS